MVKNNNLEIFISSSNDLKKETGLIENTIYKLNDQFKNRKFNIKIDFSENVARNENGKKVLNTELKNHDLFIGIIWKDFNFNLENEFRKALKNENIRSIFYFCTKGPKSLEEIKIDDLKRIDEFKSNIGNNCAYFNFNSLEDLEYLIQKEFYLFLTQKDEKINKDLISNESNNKIYIDENFIERFNNDLDESLNALNSLEKLTDEFGIKINNTTNVIKFEDIEDLSELEKYKMWKDLIEFMKYYSEKTYFYSYKIKKHFSRFIDDYVSLIQNFDEFIEKDSKKPLILLSKKLKTSIDALNHFISSLEGIPDISPEFQKAKSEMILSTKKINYNLVNIRNMINHNTYKL